MIIYILVVCSVSFVITSACLTRIILLQADQDRRWNDLANMCVEIAKSWDRFSKQWEDVTSIPKHTTLEVQQKGKRVWNS